MMRPKHQIPRDRDYLAWVKREANGPCCLCRRLRGDLTPGQELHHWSDKGMGQKASDYEVARLCIPCHHAIQGRKRVAFARNGEWEILAALQEDALALLTAYLEDA
jgi:hypothetical protein